MIHLSFPFLFSSKFFASVTFEVVPRIMLSEKYAFKYCIAIIAFLSIHLFSIFHQDIKSIEERESMF